MTNRGAVIGVCLLTCGLLSCSETRESDSTRSAQAADLPDAVKTNDPDKKRHLLWDEGMKALDGLRGAYDRNPAALMNRELGKNLINSNGESGAQPVMIGARLLRHGDKTALLFDAVNLHRETNVIIVSCVGTNGNLYQILNELDKDWKDPTYVYRGCPLITFVGQKEIESTLEKVSSTDCVYRYKGTTLLIPGDTLVAVSIRDRNGATSNAVNIEAK